MEHASTKGTQKDTLQGASQVTVLFSSFVLIQKQISREDKGMAGRNQSFRFKRW